MTRRIAAMLVSLLSFALSTTVAQPPNAALPELAPSGPHGGKIHRIDDLLSETVFTSNSVDVYVFDHAGEPVFNSNLRGRATFSLPDDPRKYRYDLYPQPGGEGSGNGLHLAVDLSRIPDRAAIVEFALYGVTRQPMVFATAFQRRPTAAQIAIRVQRTCPVSGKPLGSMGAPPKVKIGDQDIYVCCAGCLTALESNPEIHLAQLATTTAVRATEEDAAAIAFQRTCPVMEEPLNAMGGPWKVTVKGRPVFVCCKGCIQKVQDQPDEYLHKVAALRHGVSPPRRR